MTLDTVVERIADGRNLLENLALIDINTWQTSQEVWQAWQKGAPVQGVNSANMGIYRLVNGKAVFNLLGKAGNLFMDSKFQEDVYNGILGNEFFFPQGEMKQLVQSAIGAKPSATINYSGLNVKTEGCGSNYGYVQASGKNTAEEKKLFSAVYGTDNPGDGKRVYLLRKNVVKKQLKSKKDDVVARACYFYYNQNFDADDRSINSDRSAVRGVRRREVAVGDDAQKGVYRTAALLPYTHENVLAWLEKNPLPNDESVARVVGVLNDYYQSK